jgi:MYXO-CTERM domain-containing protein
MPTETPPSEPKLVVGPLALLALAAFWRGIRRRKPIALSVGIAAALVELGSSDYRRFKRRWTVFSISNDE